MGDLTTTNVLLAVVAILAFLQAVALTVAIVAVLRAYRRLSSRVADIERDLGPVAARARVILDRIDRISARVDEGTEKLDTALALTVRGAGLALSQVNGRVKRTATLVTGFARGIKAARDAWRSGSSHPTLRVVERPAPKPLQAKTS